MNSCPICQNQLSQRGYTAFWGSSELPYYHHYIMSLPNSNVFWDWERYLYDKYSVLYKTNLGSFGNKYYLYILGQVDATKDVEFEIYSSVPFYSPLFR